ncbi:hypothetical protein EV643_104122 [Kribbella sp. VKM Ac-2527]|uniref:Excreted virulence factor EspC (Type VII ESX diderm) n=1 Tax=Kribbella caucasensis TaxID=2512215 RepID=A0A4R6KI87_9ACTN|nr:hypothetical protein [Kribbella sp. VKM Ac-2527]TDO50629.1 hypothetical protein EV643_104122 [Kribbella sp. VKM Ac-2527]
MANPASQMYLNPLAAQQASTASADTSAQMHIHKNAVDNAVTGVIGTGWVMRQATSFLQAHYKWREAMEALVMALDKLSGDANKHRLEYAANDDEWAGGFARIPEPSTLGHAMRGPV